MSQRASASVCGAAWRFVAMLALIGSVACRRAEAQQTLQITIRQKSIDLAIRDTVTLHAVVTVSPTQEALMTVQWSSDNDAVADVDKRGVVTARAPGVTGITARVGTAFATTRVTVSSRTPSRERPGARAPKTSHYSERGRSDHPVQVRAERVTFFAATRRHVSAFTSLSISSTP